jgi:diadenosine tetraphosphate (Ap4A) HIT family hydrolase
MENCPLCVTTPHELLWQDAFCRVVLLNDSDYPAYCRVELKAHIPEMTDLSPADRARTMKVVFAVESAIREVIKPSKVNLASLGNKTPHMHWHVIPRFEDDKHFPNSHWGDAIRESKLDALNSETKQRLAERVVAFVDCALAVI